MKLTDPPILVSSILHNEPWSYPLLSSDVCTASHLVCTRCHIRAQIDLLRPQQSSTCLFAMALLGDVLTLGCPIGFYPGLGSAALGCYARTLLRFKFRLAGPGMHDMAKTVCCAPCAVRQQEKELEKEGLMYRAPCSSMT